MNVGRRADYALRALSYLAAQPSERIVTRSEIQAQQAIPPYFLSKILRRLVSAGVLRSAPGAHGGFRLGRPAGQISVREVYECLEGDLSLNDCLDHSRVLCGFVPVCTQRQVWRGAQRMLINYLDGISIGEIADQQGLVSRLEGRHRRSGSRP